MELDEIRALYIQQQRIDVNYSGTRREVTEHVVRVIDDERGSVVYSRLNEANADAVIAAEIAYFRRIGIADDFEWKLYEGDQPADLKDRLIRHGFEPSEPPDAILALDLSNLPPKLAAPVTHDIRRVRDLAGLDDIYSVIEQVWSDEDHGSSKRYHGKLLLEQPDAESMYCAYVDGKPVSEGWIDFSGKDFSGLWGGATLPEYRNQGIYTALVAVRAQEAIRRGKRILTIDASPMSRAVLEKQGFQLITSAWECLYKGE
ncbi:MAG: GNAT family N-acetyltransferase [Anaerolinea sp.]|nr:GNAT family N-acetyltransferase [Anaerolinea sp.]